MRAILTSLGGKPVVVARKAPRVAVVRRWTAGGGKSQDGVVALLQLFVRGSGYDEVRGLVRRGVLHPKHRGVFAVGHPRLTVKGGLPRALACGDTAFLSGRTALADAGLRPMNLKAIEVTVVAKRTRSTSVVPCDRTSKAPHRARCRPAAA